MKINFTIACIILFLSFSSGNFADELLTGELIINNSSGQAITIKLYPVSMVFNGYDDNGAHNYDLQARYWRDNIYHYINGANLNGNLFTIANGNNAEFNHDHDNDNTSCLGAVGYGKYKLEVYTTPDEGAPVLRDTCTIEWDNNYYEHGLTDLTLYIESPMGVPKINRYYWTGYNTEFLPADKFLRSWIPDGSHQFSKNYGNFKYDASHGNNYTIIPQDSRRDCGSENHKLRRWEEWCLNHAPNY